jgi:hypothetical protein
VVPIRSSPEYPALAARFPRPITASIGFIPPDRHQPPGRRFPPDDPVPRTEGDDSPPLFIPGQDEAVTAGRLKGAVRNFERVLALPLRISRVPLSRSLRQRQPAAQTRPPLHRIRSGARLVRCAGVSILASRSWPFPATATSIALEWVVDATAWPAPSAPPTAALQVSAHAILFTYEGIAQCTRMSTSLHRQIGL